MEKWLNSITTSFRNTWTGQVGGHHDQQQEQEALAEERRKTKLLADKFDNLRSAGYENILQVLTEKVNAEISEATRSPLEPEMQRIRIIRWNAMREMLDTLINHVNDTMTRRDEIEKEERSMEAEQING